MERHCGFHVAYKSFFPVFYVIHHQGLYANRRGVIDIKSRQSPLQFFLVIQSLKRCGKRFHSELRPTRLIVSQRCKPICAPNILECYCSKDDCAAVTGLFKQAQPILKSDPRLLCMPDDPFQYDLARDLCYL